VIRIPQSKNIYESFSPDHVDQPLVQIKKDIVGISNDRRLADHLSGTCEALGSARSIETPEQITSQQSRTRRAQPRYQVEGCSA
jgi:hypothetical protein